ncbi:hypothetical protein SK128_003219 [Halocaridina rubra]|uniref:Ig-like domain-containing protein n=1 Tax=Halocaridina rubra TaxID=373956 RepID=A0AAN8WI86_HALRR
MLPMRASKREGSAVRLTCHLPSLPAANIIWFKGSQPLPMTKLRNYLFSAEKAVVMLTHL